MLYAITTKFINPTNVRGARVKASQNEKRVILPWDHALNVEQNHIAAAKALMLKLGNPTVALYGGAIDEGYVFVRVYEGDKPAFTVGG